MTLKRGVGMDAKSKTCSKCGEEKLLGEFQIKKGGKYGRGSRCKLCRRKYRQDNKEKIAARAKQHYQDNKEKIAARIKHYYQDNKEKIAAKMKRYAQDNKEKIAKRKKRWQRDNKEKIAKRKKQWHQDNKEKIKQYRKENKERIKEYQKQYKQDNADRLNQQARTRFKNDEQFRTRCKLSSGLKQALKKIGKTKTASILTYIGCSIEFMKEHLNSTKKPDWGDDLHIDHIIPCSLFDHTDEEEIKKCWNWRNLRYLPSKENMSKHNTLDMYLVKSYGIEDLLPEGVDK